jgi:hypothetical protein
LEGQDLIARMAHAAFPGTGPTDFLISTNARAARVNYLLLVLSLKARLTI